MHQGILKGQNIDDFKVLWQILEALLPEGMTIPSAFETVGHIAHLNLRDEHLPYKKLIAKVLSESSDFSIFTIFCLIIVLVNQGRKLFSIHRWFLINISQRFRLLSIKLMPLIMTTEQCNLRFYLGIIPL